MDLAKRAYDHGFRLDPIVRSLLDTDFYKLLMLQMIWREHRDVPVVFQVINRTTRVRLADEIDINALREQLDHARTLRFTNKELVWLAGNSFYGVKQIFRPDFIAWLTDYRLPDYDLSVQDGQYVLTFSGGWAEVTLWEIPALAILNELRCRVGMRRLGRFELDILYSRAKTRLWSKVERLRALPDLALSDFGTRRRHGFLWQRWCIQALKEGLGSSFIGTSNVLHAMENDLEAIGTNGHELPMVMAALASDDAALAQVPYAVLDEWRRHYAGNLLIVLPDAFGTEAFLDQAPEWVADWTGFRPDSAPPIVAGEQSRKSLVRLVPQPKLSRARPWKRAWAASMPSMSMPSEKISSFSFGSRPWERHQSISRSPATIGGAESGRKPVQSATQSGA